jgi:hypothetical protein
MLYLINTSDWLRMALLYSHLILCALAISAVLKADISIMAGRYSATALRSTANTISLLLMALWATGLGVIYLDTGFAPAILLTKSKLLLKLMCVVALTINGVLLHRLSFPLLTRADQSLTIPESILLVGTGAVSTSHWMLAAFVGLAKPLGRLPFETLLAAYGLFCACVLTAALFFVPLLLNRLSPPQASVRPAYTNR